LTQEQQRCLVAAIGEKAFAELMGSQRAPTLDEVAKIKGCGIPVGTGP
jgi:hypothetical protein